jgi:hypothetical protein
MKLSSIEAQAIDNVVALRLFGDDELILEFTLAPMDAVNVARTMMEKAAEAVTQLEPANHEKHRRTED